MDSWLSPEHNYDGRDAVVAKYHAHPLKRREQSKLSKRKLRSEAAARKHKKEKGDLPAPAELLNNPHYK